jgi:predicted negative regulator of RcsB-dependent stress response
MNNQQPLLKKIGRFHYTISGVILAGVIGYMAYSLVQVINTNDDAAYYTKSKKDISTQFDSETIQRIGELQYSEKSESEDPLPARNPFTN